MGFFSRGKKKALAFANTVKESKETNPSNDENAGEQKSQPKLSSNKNETVNDVEKKQNPTEEENSNETGNGEENVSLKERNHSVELESKEEPINEMKKGEEERGKRLEVGNEKEEKGENQGQSPNSKIVQAHENKNVKDNDGSNAHSIVKNETFVEEKKPSPRRKLSAFDLAEKKRKQELHKQAEEWIANRVPCNGEIHESFNMHYQAAWRVFEPAAKALQAERYSNGLIEMKGFDTFPKEYLSDPDASEVIDGIDTSKCKGRHANVHVCCKCTKWMLEAKHLEGKPALVKVVYRKYSNKMGNVKEHYITKCNACARYTSYEWEANII